jgi:hypothetical protein
MMLGRDPEVPYVVGQSVRIGQKAAGSILGHTPAVYGVIAVHSARNVCSLEYTPAIAIAGADIDHPKRGISVMLCKPGNGNQWLSNHSSHLQRVPVQDPTTQELTAFTA